LINTVGGERITGKKTSREKIYLSNCPIYYYGTACIEGGGGVLQGFDYLYSEYPCVAMAQSVFAPKMVFVDGLCPLVLHG
jgi:hypothetical protein